MSVLTMDRTTNFADQLMDPSPQIFAQIPQSNLPRIIDDFQTALLPNYQLPHQELPRQPYSDMQSHQEIAGLYTGGHNGSFSMKELLEDTPSLEAFLREFSSDQSNSTDLDNISPSIHQLITPTAVQLPGLDMEYQHQRVPIPLPDSSTAATKFWGPSEIYVQQGIMEPQNATPIAVINPLTNEMASSSIQQGILEPQNATPIAFINPLTNEMASSAIQQGIMEPQNATPIAFINPLTNEMASSAIQRGIMEPQNATPIAVINPLTNEMASSATASPRMTDQNPHRLKSHAWTTPITEPVNDHSKVAIPTASQINLTLETSSARQTIQSDPKEKSKAKKKRSRAERTTPSSSPSSSLVLEKKKQKTIDSPKAKVECELPSGNELHIQLFYQENMLEDKKINSRDGFLVYHKKEWKFPNSADLDLTSIEFPQLQESPTKFKMTESQKKWTEMLLDAMTKGVHVYRDENENIYVERYCQSHVICYTTDLGEDDITDDVLQRPDSLYKIKLEQGKRVKVFDNDSFSKKMIDRYLHKIQIKSPPPCVILSFGQTWQEGFPLSNNLVYMKITPRKQREQYSIEETPSLDCNQTCLELSMTSLSLSHTEPKCAR